MLRSFDTSVLIVGAGPVGLTLAMELASRGVDVTVTETRRAGEPPNVKCNQVSARSMEIFRRLGLADRIRNTGLPPEYRNDVAMCVSVLGTEIRPNSLSACGRNEAADLLRSGEDHVGPVSHHTGSHQRRRALLRAIVADIGLEAQVAFPEDAHLPVRGGDLIGVAAMIDRLHAILRIELFQIRHGAAAHHHAAHLAATSRGLGGMAGPRYVLEIRQQIGALPRVFHSG